MHCAPPPRGLDETPQQALRLPLDRPKFEPRAEEAHDSVPRPGPSVRMAKLLRAESKAIAPDHAKGRQEAGIWDAPARIRSLAPAKIAWQCSGNRSPRPTRVDSKVSDDLVGHDPCEIAVAVCLATPLAGAAPGWNGFCSRPSSCTMPRLARRSSLVRHSV